jgi:hypothetical protein
LVQLASWTIKQYYAKKKKKNNNNNKKNRSQELPEVRNQRRKKITLGELWIVHNFIA